MSTDFIRYTGNSTFYYSRMCHQCTFYFERADTVTGTLDDIVGTSYKPEVSVFVFPGYITGIIDAVMPCFACTFCIPIVFFEESEWFSLICTDNDLSLFTGFY